jgi:hypothetical protein
MTHKQDGLVVQATVDIQLDPYAITDEDRLRFSERLVEMGDCLVWAGSTGIRYGKFHCGGRKTNAHVFAYYADKFGHLPASGQEQVQVAHSCKTPLCCNPAHLRLATQIVNLAERVYPCDVSVQEIWTSILRSLDSLRS